MGVSMISFSQSEEVVAAVMKEPYVNVCTDGLLGGRPHPRAYGTYPRILGRYVRELKMLSLEEAVRKMTSQAADAMHLPERGRIAVGKVADLVAFDAAQVIDRATFADPLQEPLGIQHVVVNGVAVIAGGAATGARPGRAVRRHV
jgi:N-acyl-D-amino-acid deacylase